MIDQLAGPWEHRPAGGILNHRKHTRSPWIRETIEQAEREGHAVTPRLHPAPAKAQRGRRPLAKPWRPGVKPKRKVRLSAAGRRDLERAKAVSYALREAAWQDKLKASAKKGPVTDPALERAKRRRRIRRLAR